MGLSLRWALTPHLPRLPAGSLESTEHTYVYKVQGSGGTPPQTPTGTRTKQRLPGTSVPMPELTATEERCSYFPGASHNAFMTCIPLSSWFFNQKFYFSPSKSSSPCPWASQVALVVENPLANAGDLRDMGSIPGSGRSPGGGNDNPLQCSCLGNAKDGRAWRPTVHGVTELDPTEVTEHTCTPLLPQPFLSLGEPPVECHVPPVSTPLSFSHLGFPQSPWRWGHVSVTSALISRLIT